MPERIIRPGILTSEAVNELSWGAEVFYRRLMSIVDDYGRYDARPKILLAQLYALQLDRVRTADVEIWLQECVSVGLIICYTHENKPYLEVARFNQRTRSASKWPAPPATDGEAPPSAADSTNPQANVIPLRAIVSDSRADDGDLPTNDGDSRAIDSSPPTNDGDSPQSAAVFVVGIGDVVECESPPMRARAREEGPPVERTVVTIFAEAFGHDPPLRAQEEWADCADLTVFAETIRVWKVNGYSAQNFTGIKQRYAKELKRQQQEQTSAETRGKPAPKTHNARAATGLRALVEQAISAHVAAGGDSGADPAGPNP